ncbi:peptidylprolyl isomerase [Nocardioides limicola]|uniref:peptidylprolyl isomerase n=1 Tax=Nocardioides limicola TaxID=2803368 RepID=UPI00193AFB0E|nr:peptidylprolyl isomerase [Nocardioides sp. DJM-14]
MSLRAAAVLPAALLLILTGCTQADTDEPEATATDDVVETSPPTEPTEPAADATCVYTESGQAARAATLPPGEPTESGDVEVAISTSLGDFTLTLDADGTPCTVNSFLSLAEQGFYDDTPCPRITTFPTFGILQCGDPTGTGMGGPGYRYADELAGTETYPAGTLAMANSGADTNGSQFFFVFSDTQLSPDYTVFGTFDTAGVDLIQEVAAEGDDGSHPAGGGAPATPIDIISISR